MGIVFKNIERPYFLITNFKVMYSTLLRQPNLKQQSYGEMIRAKDATEKYLLTRDPYKRLESFYRDKFILYPRRCTYTENFAWQHCERIFLRHYNINQHDFEETKQALINTSFEQFIHMLPDTYRLDRHLIPQALAAFHFGNGVATPIEFDGILQMENEGDMLFVRDGLEINTSIQVNVTRSAEIPIVWNQSLRKVVNSLYQSDFEGLGYNMV